MAPTTHVGVALAVLVAVAAAVAAWLLFARADERARADDDRASDSAVEALESGPGRVIASLRGGNKRRACRELGISYHTLRSYLRFRPP